MATTFLNLGMSLDYEDVFPCIVREDYIIPKTHEYLFHFLEADFSRLEAYGKSYLECLTQGTNGDAQKLQRIFEELFALHPFFRSCPTNAAAVINVALATYVRTVFRDRTEEQQKDLINCVCTAQYIGSKDIDLWFEKSYDGGAEHIFQELHDLQHDIATWVFLALDNTNPELSKLTSLQRSAMFNMIFGGEYTPMLETEVEMTMQRPRSFNGIEAALDFDEEFTLATRKSIEAMQAHPTAPLPEQFQRIYTAAQQVQEDCEAYTYRADTLEDILKFEVYGMSHENTRIKRCKNCGRYFILEKGNLEYCDRIAAGETKPCNEIGKSRTYEARITGGDSAIALYRKAYKTHFARIRTGKMTKEEFEAWKNEATEKRKLTERGSMDFAEYTQWLKI